MIDERAENQIYNKLIEDQLRTAEGAFCPFRREKQMDHLFRHLADDFKVPGRSVLDICGGYGRLTYFLNEFDPRHEYYCVDYSEALVAKAKEAFSAHRNIHCEVADLYALPRRYEKAFDVTINYKTLSWLPYYEKAIEQFVKVTRDKIYITSQFFEGDIDFICRIYPAASAGDANKYSYLNCYGIPKFVKYCQSLGVRKVEFEDMRLDFDIEPPPSKNILKTYTVPTQNQGRLEVTGIVILNWKLAVLTL